MTTIHYETLKECLHPNFDDYFMQCNDCNFRPELFSNCCGAAIEGSAADIAAVNNSLTTCDGCKEHCVAVLEQDINC